VTCNVVNVCSALQQRSWLARLAQPCCTCACHVWQPLAMVLLISALQTGDQCTFDKQYVGKALNQCCMKWLQPVAGHGYNNALAAGQ
jgi:hypothetical protein